MKLSEMEDQLEFLGELIDTTYIEQVDSEPSSLHSPDSSTSDSNSINDSFEDENKNINIENR